MRWLAEFSIASALAFTTLAGCVEEDTSETSDDPPKSLADRDCPDESDLTYESFGRPFVLNWCAGCHSKDLPEAERQGAPLDSNFDTLKEVRSDAARIWARSADHNLTMPPVGGPEADERVLFGEWLACGAPTREDD
jgi:uncharacterized membrane protein